MASAQRSGVAVVDKPRGVSSHTVVAQARRVFARKDIGHAGTLDPMATGVLLLLIGQATKLSAYLTADVKRYAADITFGRATDSLDADGQVTLEVPVDPAQLGAASVEAALAAERSRREQVPPAVSAIKVAGERSYALARKGQAPELAPRAVEVLELTAIELKPPLLRCEVLVSKGYYVRSLARDLGQHLGLPAHLSGLRRLASGSFRIEQSTAWPPTERPALLGLAEAACAALPACRLKTEAVGRARQGKLLAPEDFDVLPDGPEWGAWLTPDGELVAVGTLRGELRVQRGFNSEL